MLAPPVPGRRPEKLRFNLSLLFTEDGIEYSAAEVRARSMGLLNKKWGPPPPSESRELIRVNFNDDGTRSTQNMGYGKRKSTIIVGEPTVTINTKEALADVFGMYNSPDKTVKRMMPGSKHAPVKRIEPMTPATRQASPVVHVENNENARTPGKYIQVHLYFFLIFLKAHLNPSWMKTQTARKIVPLRQRYSFTTFLHSMLNPLAVQALHR